MNILVKTYGSTQCYCRPDTTWERENRDFYSPESVNEIDYTPVVFARISKAGKCIGSKFVERYYDSFNFGVLLYCRTEETSDIAFSSCADHSSFLPMPLYNIEVLENGENTFEFFKGDEKVYEVSCGEGIKESLEEAICKASVLTSLRIGDYVAIELAGPQHLTSKTAGSTAIKARFCENETISVNMIF